MDSAGVSWVSRREGLGRTWILPGLAGLKVGQRKVVLTRSTAEGSADIMFYSLYFIFYIM